MGTEHVVATHGSTVDTVTVRLRVRTAEWRASVARVAASVPGLVPVVKGNGYGFGRVPLAELASELADTIAVGTVHELLDLPPGFGSDVLVLTPLLDLPQGVDPARTVLTVGRPEHLAALTGWGGRVVVKVESSMHRYGTDDLPSMVASSVDAGLDVCGVALHLPLDDGSTANRDEVLARLGTIDPAHEVWLSHLSDEHYGSLPETHRYRLRLGTRLWLGARQTLHLSADVLDVRPVEAGSTVGYRRIPAEHDGHLVMVGAGTANGVTPLPDGRSPFHFDRVRMPLHEPPHMHTSMCLVAAPDPCPPLGDWVDVQRPLTMTAIDDIDWL
jgi:alanine racemase